jgi:uncharacterized protein YndB with AHSA1/START domain
MNDADTKKQTADVVLEFKLDEPPEKVWRAISIPAFRERWLPNETLIDAEPESCSPGERFATGCATTSRPSSKAW